MKIICYIPTIMYKYQYYQRIEYYRYIINDDIILLQIMRL